MGETKTLTLHDMLGSVDPRSKHIDMYLGITDHASFLKALHYAIENLVQVQLERAKDEIIKDEDHISGKIVDMLYALNYDASREESSNGNVDITVKLAGYIWLAEAKIFNSNPYLVEGFKQLASRYSTASNINANKGGYFIYNFRPNTKDLIDKYKIYSKPEIRKVFSDYQIEDCPNHPLRFFTTHLEASSGPQYGVKHFPFSFHHDPVDKSGIKSKASRDKKRKL